MHVAAAKRTPDKIDVNQLAKLFGLSDFDKIDEHNLDYYWETGDWAYKYAIEQGESEEEAEKAREKAEEEARDELFGKWHDGVMSAAENLFEKHELTLAPIRPNERRPYEYKIVPTKSWRAALEQIIETINGVGYYHFNSVREFLDSGPYTEREGVLSHIHWIKDYPAVYGDTSAERYFERAFR